LRPNIPSEKMMPSENGGIEEHRVAQIGGRKGGKSQKPFRIKKQTKTTIKGDTLVGNGPANPPGK